MKPILLSLLLLAAILSCKKNNTDVPASGLPDTSSVGKNFLACRVNGQVHIYSGKGSINNDNSVGYGFFNEYVGITADNSSYKDDIRFHIDSKNALLAGLVYDFSMESNIYALYLRYDESGHLHEYKSQTGSGWIRFSRIDTAVAAGTFAFTAYLNGQRGADSVVVTDGRFDIAR